MKYTLIDSVYRGGVNSLISPCKINDNVYVAGSPLMDQYNVSNIGNIELVASFKFYGGSAEIECSNTDVYAVIPGACINSPHHIIKNLRRMTTIQAFWGI